MQRKEINQLYDFAEFYVRNILNQITDEYLILDESKMRILIELIKLEIKTNSIASSEELETYLNGSFRDEMKILMED